jgi:hypothetical protein
VAGLTAVNQIIENMFGQSVGVMIDSLLLRDNLRDDTSVIRSSRSYLKQKPVPYEMQNATSRCAVLGERHLPDPLNIARM